MKRNTQQPTVTFQNPNVSPSAEECEEVDYVNAAVSTDNNLPANLDEKPCSLTQSVPTIAVSWVILSVTLALHIYFTSVISENNTKLTEENQQLILENKKLLEQLKENQTALLEENHDLTIRYDNLREAYDLSELRFTNLTTENQGLKTQSNNLRQQIQDKETEWIQSNVTRAQWSINAYCPIRNNGRQCQPCQKDWTHKESSCYAFNNPEPPDQKTWTEARENCRKKGSDLVVIADEAKKTYVRNFSYGDRFWIGLTVVDGKWKWVDGSELTDSFWTERPVEGHCLVFVREQKGWESVSCGVKNQWICGNTALSV